MSPHGGLFHIVGTMFSHYGAFFWHAGPPPCKTSVGSGVGATGAIAPVPVFQGGAPLQFLVHLFLVNFAYILQKLSFDLGYYW